MNRTTLLFLLILQFHAFAQTKTDLEKEGLKGKVKTTLSYKITADKKSDTLFFSKISYSKNGMKEKYLDIENDYGYKPIRGIDSTTYAYDTKNRLSRSSEYEWFKDDNEGAKEYRESTDTFIYDEKCSDIATQTTTIKKKSKKESSTDTWIVTYRYNTNCKMTFMKEVGRGRTNTTLIHYDSKDRIIRRTFTYEDEKPDKLETYDYDDPKNTVTYLEYSPRYDVYREKTKTQFNANKKIVQKTFYNAPTAGGSITFTKGSKTEPDQIYLIKNYGYNNDHQLQTETHLDGNNKELVKVEVFYDAKKELKEQKFYKNGQLEYREEYQYSNGNRLEESQFLPNKKSPEYIKSRKFNAANQLTEFVLSEGKNKYSNIYIYDKNGNEIEKRELKNGQLENTEFTEIEYYL